MRGHFLRAGKISEWNSGIRSYIEDKLADAVAPTVRGADSNSAGKFAKSMFDNEEQRRIVEAAIGDGPLLARWQKLGKALEAVRHQLPEGAPTATEQMFQKTLGQKVIAPVTKVLKAKASPMHSVEETMSRVKLLDTPEGRKKLANYLLSPEGDKALQSLPLIIHADKPLPSRLLPVLGGIFSAAGIGGTARNKEDIDE